MAGGAGTFRDDHANLVINEAAADYLADRMATRFHATAQKLKGGTLTGGPGGGPGPNPVVQNQWGGKGIIKFNPTSAEIVQGIKQQVSLFTWESPDGLPHFVTIEVGRIAGGIGGPGADGTKGGLTVVSPMSAAGQGSIGGGSWPAAQDSSGNPLSYRACAQVLLGTPGTMQDPFFIDINRGQRFTALASYVAITAQMNAPPIDDVTGAVVVPQGFTNPYVSGSLATYATLGMGVAPSLAPTLYTQYIDTKNVNGSLNSVRTIPPRANFLMPILPSSNNDVITLSFFDNSGNAIGTTPPITYGAAGVNGLPITPIALSEDYYGVELSSTNAGLKVGVPITYRLVYQLSV